MRTPGPHFPRSMETWISIFQENWGDLGPYIPRRMETHWENGDPGFLFSQESGDPLVKLGTPSMADCFPRSMRTICKAARPLSQGCGDPLYGWPFLQEHVQDPLYGRSV